MANLIEKIEKKVCGSARILQAYSRVKKMQTRMPLEEIAETFDLSIYDLRGFINICDSLVEGEQIFHIDLGQAEKCAEAIS
ncbi:hypothetical protein DENIS_3389 [Desulfonema ishimotonii]|uniref:Uncharacterized protein n=1 Tax=Desulfonema ishimotonii TaxID=45657 RepID=A0A401FZP4_9BACT|nr:hypothetical protein [Desulfonema ishimotonii]GBC62417.1 hypothetical protein DENIS_3389 [Desulfonema ishimotonii]